MPDFSPWYAARQHMVDSVRRDLYGSPEDEYLSEAPLERYIVGILHPIAGGAVSGEIEDANETPEQEAGVAFDAEYDPGVSFAHLRYPSTIGLTFGLSSATEEILVEVAADRYLPNDADVGAAGESPADTPRSNSWRRVPVEAAAINIPVGSATSSSRSVADGLELRYVVRSSRDGVISVTLVLINSQPRPEKGRVDHLCWFRPEIRVRTNGGEFIDRRPTWTMAHMDADERGGELLYRKERSLAVGHGVAVTWTEGERVTDIATTFFPEHDLPLAKADRDDVPGLWMPALAQAPDVDSLSEPLLRLVGAYEGWISTMESKVDGLPTQHVATAQANVSEARRAATRMRAGVARLENDPLARTAFQTMNAAMQKQREKQEWIRNGSADVVGQWRPFQMAFILINLEGLADPKSGDRDVADLLWFPTGGGKTEAYLGLIAFALVHRRLRKAGDDALGGGVSVIMRYTLRLLTLQQFERAAGLICALEELRDCDPVLRDTAPFSIGLWVGMGATPNSVEAAATALRKLRNNEDPGDGGNPVQLLRCPWCGSTLSSSDYDANRRAGKMTVRCPSLDCRFHQGEGLPVHLVDDDVYRVRPSLVISTVDKFAMLAWNERAGQLFGKGGSSSTDATPDLIVQDELHLISGPLGTLVGLYETAIDLLSTDPETGSRPKLIASTATVRRASAQVSDVFNRETRQFPPPGINADDSFFAVDATAEERGTRRYVGLMAPSTSHATLLVRTYAALLQGGQDLDAVDEVKDAYWTLLGYFNSLRVLGAAYIQSIDDVPDRIKVVATRQGRDARIPRDPSELTSRIRSSEIPTQLERLQTSYPDPSCPDIVLATNMISVGVDVDRLGLMAVMGQPQTTSEYIQSTSRVGRKYPGLVFTLFNASRSRDLSHYESFTSYHRALYKQVEAAGATPFAPRALDRGLHGLLVILARHIAAGAASDKAVGVPPESDVFKRIEAVVSKRAHEVADPATAEQVEHALAELSAIWSDSWAGGGLHKYAEWFGRAKDEALMIPAGSAMSDGMGGPLAETFPPTDTPWPTLTSLRNVDRESSIKLVRSTRNVRPQHGED